MIKMSNSEPNFDNSKGTLISGYYTKITKYPGTVVKQDAYKAETICTPISYDEFKGAVKYVLTNYYNENYMNISNLVIRVSPQSVEQYRSIVITKKELYQSFGKEDENNIENFTKAVIKRINRIAGKNSVMTTYFAIVTVDKSKYKGPSSKYRR